jgi:hypothetical protein
LSSSNVGIAQYDFDFLSQDLDNDDDVAVSFLAEMRRTDEQKRNGLDGFEFAGNRRVTVLQYRTAKNYAGRIRYDENVLHTRTGTGTGTENALIVIEPFLD